MLARYSILYDWENYVEMGRRRVGLQRDAKSIKSSNHSEAIFAHCGVRIQNQNCGTLANEKMGWKDGEFESY
jgi:hypothetical protein